MYNLPPDYLAELARHLVFVCAFLGGFAATFLGTLLGVKSDRAQAGWAIGSAAVAASAFIVAVIAWTGLLILLHPDAPEFVAETSSMITARIIGLLGLVIGMYALLLSLGLSEWLRSRRVGIVTSVATGLSALIATWAIAGF